MASPLGSDDTADTDDTKATPGAMEGLQGEGKSSSRDTKNVRGPITASKRESLRDVFRPKRRGSITIIDKPYVKNQPVIKQPITKTPSDDTKPARKSSRRPKTNEPRDGLSRTGAVLPRSDKSAKVISKVKAVSKAKSEVVEALPEPPPPNAFLIDSEGFYITPVMEIVKGAYVVNLHTKRKFKILRKTTDPLFNSSQSNKAMWVLGLDNEEFLASEDSLKNPVYYQILTPDDIDAEDIHSYRLRLPEKGAEG